MERREQITTNDVFQLLTRQQVAKILNISICQLQRLANEGRGLRFLDLSVEHTKRPTIRYRMSDVMV